MTKYTNNPYYDFVTAWSGEPIPSTRSGYKKVANGMVVENPVTSGVHFFRQLVRYAFRNIYEFKTPYNGPILISLSIGLKRKDYKERDIDNMVKSLLDALKTVVFTDDSQVVSLHVIKFESKSEIWNIGIKKLKEEDSRWQSQPLYLEAPFIK